MGEIELEISDNEKDKAFIESCRQEAIMIKIKEECEKIQRKESKLSARVRAAYIRVYEKHLNSLQ